MILKRDTKQHAFAVLSLEFIEGIPRKLSNLNVRIDEHQPLRLGARRTGVAPGREAGVAVKVDQRGGGIAAADLIDTRTLARVVVDDDDLVWEADTAT